MLNVSKLFSNHNLMGLKKVLIIVLLIGLIIPAFILWKSPEAETIAPTPSKPRKLINPYLQSFLGSYESELRQSLSQTGTPGAAVAIVYDSSIVFQKGFGVKATGSNDSVDVNTVFRIGSVSKGFASFLTGILVEEGILSWNDCVVNHYPEFALQSEGHTQSINLTHVLSHTTGLPYHTYTNLIEEGLPISNILNRLPEVKLIGDPGEIYSYQNVAYSAIGEVIHCATDLSYETLMEERVFKPLGMHHASLSYDRIMKENAIAMPHQRFKKVWRPVPISENYYNASPAGGINASVSDMAKWMLALLGNREDVISRNTLSELRQPIVKTRLKNWRFRKLPGYESAYYGLGWRILHYNSDTLIYHGGYVNGYRSEVAFSPRDRIGICILMNAPTAFASQCIPQFLTHYNQYRGRISRWQEGTTLVSMVQ